jgi:phosphopantothenoylcysteine decarboxylase/phosphopantothenate--cysteine ligase
VGTADKPRVVLGVAGGIAAYKACELLRQLTETGHDVRVVPTEGALRFVGEPTWAALSGHPVHTGVWSDAHEVPHVRLGREADLVVVAPATADLLARAAHGLAADLLTNTLLTARCPVLLAPAMHTEMWEHPATRANVATLRERGTVVLDPAVGRLTGADTGRGRLPDPVDIADLARLLLADPDALPRDLAGRRVLVTAGGTREALDPVRFLGNRSSGRQGYALALVAAARGAEVTVVAANVALPDPTGVTVLRVSSAAELHDVTLAAARDVDAVVMAAAVADFRPAMPSRPRSRRMPARRRRCAGADRGRARRPARRPPAGQVIVGFAAETGDDEADWLEHGRRKLARKGADLLVVNPVGDGLAFGQKDNSGVVLTADGGEIEIPSGPKTSLAAIVWTLVADRLG